MVIKNGVRKKLEIFIRISEKVFGINKYCMMTWGYILQYIVAYGVMIDYNWWGTNDRRGTPPAEPELGTGREEPREDKVNCFTYFWIFTGQDRQMSRSLYSLPDGLTPGPLSPRASPPPVFPRHRGDGGEGVHYYLLRSLPQVVAVHWLEHPPGSLDLLQRQASVPAQARPPYLRLAPRHDEGRLEVVSRPGTSPPHHQVLPLPLLHHHHQHHHQHQYTHLRLLCAALLVVIEREFRVPQVPHLLPAPFPGSEDLQQDESYFHWFKLHLTNLPGPSFQSTFSVSLSLFEPSPLKVLRME